MSRSREFVRSLLGPQVLFAFAAGVIQGCRFLVPEDGGGGDPPRDWAGPFLLGLLAAAGAVLARRLTGNGLVSATAGALFVVRPDALSWNPGNYVAATLGILAAGIRLLPSADLERQPLFGKREVLALLLLLAGAFSSPLILAMPVLILLADLAYAPAGPRAVLNRTGRLFLVQVLAVLPALLIPTQSMLSGRIPSFDPLVAEPTFGEIDQILTGAFLPWPVPRIGFWLTAAIAAAAVVILIMRGRIRQTLVIAAAFAVSWVIAAYGIPVLAKPDGVFQGPVFLVSFGPALLVATILWRIAVAAAGPRGAEIVSEAPLPSVPALRDVIKPMRAEPRPAAPVAVARSDGALGVRTTVERAVAGAVAATLEQIRLAFRGPHVAEPPGTPEHVLWNRLMTQASGGAQPDERPASAVGRWQEFQATHLDPWIKAGGVVVCAGATPWPLAASLGQSRHRVIVVERTPRTAALAADDLAGAAGVSVVRHEGRGLAPIGDSTVDAVVALFEPTVASPADLLILIKECKRVLKKHGMAGVAFADLARPESHEALARGSPAAFFTNREALAVLARIAGFGSVQIASGPIAWTSIAWMTA